MKKILLTISCIVYSLVLFAQTRCLSDEYQNHEHQNSLLKKHRTQLDQNLQRTTVQAEAGKIYEIPVVIHVLWRTAQENISLEKIQTQMTVLNEDYRMKNPNANQTIAQFANLAADAEIQFKLATVDPNGNPTTGITRKQTTKTGFDYTTNEAKKANLGGIDAWDTKRYMNIWVVNQITYQGLGGTLGYAQFPGGDPLTDGVVIVYNAFGTTPPSIPPYDGGRTATHEVGHYLGLYHLWGKVSDGKCDPTDDDLIADTPMQAEASAECPLGKTSCGNLNMIQNYMDYANDDCMTLFTKGQVERMRNVLATVRKDLCPDDDYDYDIAINSIDNIKLNDCGNTVIPTIEVTNNGIKTLTKGTIQVLINDQEVKTFSEVLNLKKDEKTSIDLGEIAVNNYGSNTIKVVLSKPNDVTDENADNNYTSFVFDLQKGNLVQFKIKEQSLNNSMFWTISQNNVILQKNTNLQAVTKNQEVIYNFCLASDCYDFEITNPFKSAQFPTDDFVLFAKKENKILLSSTVKDFKSPFKKEFCTDGNDPIMVDFDVNKTSVGLCEELTFTAKTTGVITNYEWDFGQDAVPQTATGIGPHVVTYQQAGQKTILLKVNDSKEKEKKNYVTVIENVQNPSVVIATNGSVQCENTSLSIFSTIKEISSIQSYQWFVNNQEDKTQISEKFTANNLVNDDKICLEITYKNACNQLQTVKSNELTLMLTKEYTPTLTIQSTKLSLCQGESVGFSNTLSFNEKTTTLTWFVNDQEEKISPDFLLENVQNDVNIYAILKTTDVCALKKTVQSSPLKIKVEAKQNPSITIQATKQEICTGETVDFSIIQENGQGSNPIYTWFVNGESKGITTSFVLTKTSEIKVKMVSNANCLITNEVYSSTEIIQVQDYEKPNITINTNQELTICEGENLSFLASIKGGGANPLLKWKVNGKEEANTLSYSSKALKNQSEIICELTSSSTCVQQSTIQSNSLKVIVNPKVNPSLVIKTANNTVCEKEEIVVKIDSQQNQGTNPLYDWYVNGKKEIQGTELKVIPSTYTSAEIVATLTSNIACASQKMVLSNVLNVNVNQAKSVKLNIASEKYALCEGQKNTFLASTSFPLSQATFTWFVNQNKVGTGQNYAISNVKTGDEIHCQLDSKDACLSDSIILSSSIIANLLSTLNPTIQIKAAKEKGCKGETFSFSIDSVSGEGINPIYEWFVDQELKVTSSTFITNDLNHNNQVYVKLTSDYVCLNQVKTESNHVKISIIEAIEPSILLSLEEITCSNKEARVNALLNENEKGIISWYINDNFVTKNESLLIENVISDLEVYAKINSSLPCANTKNMVSNTLTINPEVCAGIEENQETYKLYPNPIEEVLYVEGAEKVEVYSIMGEQIFQVENQQEMDFSFLPSGLYVVKIYHQEKVFTKKVIKK